MHKSVFIDRHERSDMIKDWNNFLTKIDNLKPYMVEFEKDSKIKPKDYPFDYTIKGNNW